MKSLIAKVFTSGLMFCLAGSAYSESNGGSGEPTENTVTTSPLQLAVTDDQRVLIQLSDNQTLISGSAATEQGYGTLVLDAYDSEQGQIQPNWGQAEVLLGCGGADVLVYQNLAGHSIIIASESLAIPLCVE